MKLLFVLCACLALAQSTSALYFYLDAGANKCFLEELPKDTIVVGKHHTVTPSYASCLARQ